MSTLFWSLEYSPLNSSELAVESGALKWDLCNWTWCPTHRASPSCTVTRALLPSEPQLQPVLSPQIKIISLPYPKDPTGIWCLSFLWIPWARFFPMLLVFTLAIAVTKDFPFLVLQEPGKSPLVPESLTQHPPGCTIAHSPFTSACPQEKRNTAPLYTPPYTDDGIYHMTLPLFLIQH